MNRIETVRAYVDAILSKLSDPGDKRLGYSHLYGVSQACGMIAMKRGENWELAIIAGMLHDIYTYSTLDSRDHAHKGAIMAREILKALDLFTDDEIHLIYRAIYNHSAKELHHTPFDEVLKDADVLQHYLYNPMFAVAGKDKVRLEKLKEEFEL